MDTKRKYYEAIEQAVHFFENFLEATEDGILITDFSNSIIMANRSFASIFEIAAEQLLETNLLNWLERIDSDAPKVWSSLIDEVFRKSGIRGFEYSLLGRHFEISGNLV